MSDTTTAARTESATFLRDTIENCQSYITNQQLHDRGQMHPDRGFMVDDHEEKSKELRTMLVVAADAAQKLKGGKRPFEGETQSGRPLPRRIRPAASISVLRPRERLPSYEGNRPYHDRGESQCERYDPALASRRRSISPRRYREGAFDRRSYRGPRSREANVRPSGYVDSFRRGTQWSSDTYRP